MTEPEYGVVLVRSTSHALKAEQILKRRGIPYKLIPVPRHISSDCGVCLRVDAADLDEIRRLLEDQGVGVRGAQRL
jgi:superfamily I DNA/RNA helicase